MAACTQTKMPLASVAHVSTVRPLAAKKVAVRRPFPIFPFHSSPPYPPPMPLILLCDPPSPSLSQVKRVFAPAKRSQVSVASVSPIRNRIPIPFFIHLHRRRQRTHFPYPSPHPPPPHSFPPLLAVRRHCP